MLNSVKNILHYPSLYHPISLRIGAYKGGMSDVITKPIANKIKELGGEIILNKKEILVQLAGVH